MDCPGCRAPMQGQTLEGHDRPVAIDSCGVCQAFWFDAHESLRLTAASTLRLFRLIGERMAAGRPAAVTRALCPRCGAVLRLSHDMQRQTRFEYLSCPEGHGRFATFFNFLREKDFIRPLTAAQVAEIRRNLQTVNCANCGAPVNVTLGATCAHCGSPLSMLDLDQAGMLIEQLRHAEDRATLPVDPTLPLDLARARRESASAFEDVSQSSMFAGDVAVSSLVGAGLLAVGRWIRAKES
jgi:Zn-finger nucleic acid-binding protein